MKDYPTARIIPANVGGLFPIDFPEGVLFELDRPFDDLGKAKFVGGESGPRVEIRGYGPFARRAFYLSDDFGWTLAREGVGVDAQLLLIPSRKK